MQEFEKNIVEAEEFVKGLASRHRLLILCQLANGEKSVGELIEATGIAATSMSQHLGRLKRADIISYRREHRTLYYSISDPVTMQIMAILYEEFCSA